MSNPTYQKKNNYQRAEVQMYDQDGGLPAIIQERGITEQQYNVATKMIWPEAKTPEVVALAWDYCKARNLDPMKRMVHVVSFGGKEQILPSIAEARTTASRTGDYVGKDSPTFGPEISKEFDFTEYDKGEAYTVKKTISFPEWCEVPVYRFTHKEPRRYVERVFWLETYASKKNGEPNSTWVKRPMGQLAKCAEAASLRSAFPEEIGGMYFAEEMKDREVTFGNDEAEQETKPAKTSRFAERVAAEGKVVDATAEKVPDERVVRVVPVPDADADAEWSGAFILDNKTPEGVLVPVEERTAFFHQKLKELATKADRIALVQANMGFIRHLLKAGEMGQVTEIHKIADEGK